jgi:predicted P-loop ATPase
VEEISILVGAEGEVMTRNGHTTTSSCKSEALRYANEQGWYVFPAPPGKKKSYKKAEFSGGAKWGMTNDLDQIECDFKKWPKANVGLPTGTVNGFFVVDADTKEGHDVDGIANLQTLVDANGQLPETRIAGSPTGSEHYYFKCPEGVTIRNGTNVLAPGIDVRGEGGMVIAPPSIKPNVGAYEWVSEADIADAPQWLLNLVIEKKPGTELQASPDRTADPSFVDSLVELIENDDMGYDNWRNWGLRIFAAGGNFATFDKLSKKSKKYNADVTREVWGEISKRPPNRTGLDAIIKLLPWRERSKGGIPIASMHNARVAITALGIECSHDIFHNKMLFGFRDDAVQYDLGGEMSDNAIIQLRQIISVRFGFDPKEQHTRDAVISLALDHRFNPVCDLLDKAQGEWDGKKRLDRMAVDYFNCEDTPLNRACVRKMMIALARRPRHPGCKFDNIVVLESDEGWNKSSALSELAGPDNFSDESILGARGREVQEQLSTIWIHESADLAGMRKAEVESVKAFASRATDIARAAYGHFITKQPRHSIEVGTTNGKEYLQSQDGNRRFWPLKLQKRIDLDKLRRDRMQLLGEAAQYESDGEGLTLDETLWPASGEAQEQRRTKDPWDDLLDEMTYAGITTLNSAVIHLVDGQERVATSDLMENVLQIHPSQQTTGYAMRLKNAMKRLGWQRDGENKITIDGKQVRGYFRPVQKSVPPIHVMDTGQETPIADNFKAHGFEEVSRSEFVNTKQYEKMGDLAPTVQTNSMLIKSEPELPPELLALLNSPGGQRWEWEPFYRPRKHFQRRARRKVLRTARARS